MCGARASAHVYLLHALLDGRHHEGERAQGQNACWLPGCQHVGTGDRLLRQRTPCPDHDHRDPAPACHRLSDLHARHLLGRQRHVLDEVYHVRQEGATAPFAVHGHGRHHGDQTVVV